MERRELRKVFTVKSYRVASCFWLKEGWCFSGILFWLSHSVVSDCLQPPWTAAHQASLYFTVPLSFLKLVSIESVMPSNRLILCRPLLLLPSIFPSIGVFPNESVLRIRWLKKWSFSFSIRSSNEYSGSISFRMDWFDHLAAQGTLKSLLQHCSSKTSILRHSAFFMAQLSHMFNSDHKVSFLAVKRSEPSPCSIWSECRSRSQQHPVPSTGVPQVLTGVLLRQWWAVDMVGGRDTAALLRWRKEEKDLTI